MSGSCYGFVECSSSHWMRGATFKGVATNTSVGDRHTTLNQREQRPTSSDFESDMPDQNLSSITLEFFKNLILQALYIDVLL